MRSALVALLLLVGVAACGTSTVPTAVPAPVAVQSPIPGSSGTASVTPTARPSTGADGAASGQATPAPTPKPIAACPAAALEARITRWDGGMGHRTASVTLTSTSSRRCIVRGTPEVQLLGHYGRVLMDSRTDGASGLPHVAPGAPTFRLAKGDSLTTLVDTDNYCGTPPALPLTIAFILPKDAGRLVAAPGPGSATPPCLRSPGSAGSISMNGWQK